METARAEAIFLPSVALRTAARNCGSRTVSTTGAFSRARCGTRRSMPRLAHCTRPSGPTAMTASCMELSKVSSWCWLVWTATKTFFELASGLVEGVATWPISSTDVAAMRAVRSPLATRSAKLTMRCRRRAVYWAPTPESEHHDDERDHRAEQQRAMHATGSGFDVGEWVGQADGASGDRGGDVEERNANCVTAALIDADVAAEGGLHFFSVCDGFPWTSGFASESARTLAGRDR